MAYSKKDQFNKTDNYIADIAKALSHPARIEILKSLMECKTCSCGTIVENLPLAQSTISQHLKLLKDAELIEGEIDGKAICYCLNIKKLKNAHKNFLKLFDQLIAQ